MSRTLDANQLIKVDRPYVQPIYLIKITPVTGDPCYFSDRNFTYNSINYEAYIKNTDTIGEEVLNLGGYNNFQFTIEFLNQTYRGSPYLIEYFDTNVVEKRYIEIWKLFINTGEVFGSDVSTKIFKGEMGQPYNIDELAFKIDCGSMLFGKQAKLPFDVIDLADFTAADPDDVGKYRNIIYGSLKKVICPWTIAGWLSTLTADITAAQTSIVVTDSNGCPATPFTSLCENEQIRVTGNTTATGTLVVTRGYGGTTAVDHSKGAQIYHMRTDFEAEVAQHPVKSIGNIYVEKDNEWVRVISGATKNINTGGRAYITFSDKVKFEEKTIETVNPASHAHTTPMVSTKVCVPSGGTQPATYDGNENTFYSMVSENIIVSFSEGNYGTISKQYAYMTLELATGVTVTVTIGGVSAGSVVGPVSKGEFRFVRTGGAWNDQVLIGTNTSAIAKVFEVRKEVDYTPSISSTGLALSGNSLANMIIGNRVACDVEGYADPDGNYGGIGTLIERPDWIRKHILIVLLGFVAGDIDLATTWAATGALYNTGTYKFAFVLHEVATKTLDLFKKMDQQTRSIMFESAGVFKLKFMSTSAPTSVITFTKDNIKGLAIFSKSEVADLKNKLRGHFFRDYSKSGDLGVKYQKVYETPNADAATSIAKYGTLEEDIEFSCIGDLQAMVDDVMDWILLEKKELKKMVSLPAFWDATILESCDYFTLTSNFWTGLQFKTLKLTEKGSNQIIDVEGIEFISS